MLIEQNLNVGEIYLYWSPSKMKHVPVKYVGRRQVTNYKPATTIEANGLHIFSPLDNSSEIWTATLTNICTYRDIDPQID